RPALPRSRTVTFELAEALVGAGKKEEAGKTILAAFANHAPSESEVAALARALGEEGTRNALAPLVDRYPEDEALLRGRGIAVARRPIAPPHRLVRPGHPRLMIQSVQSPQAAAFS